MKRFYCTICKRVKRVRRLNTTVANEHATRPQDRVGQCLYHTLGHHKTPKAPRPSRKPIIIAVPKPARRKKGGQR